jgi:hypothetical protein
VLKEASWYVPLAAVARDMDQIVDSEAERVSEGAFQSRRKSAYLLSTLCELTT